MELSGIHHVTAITADASANFYFYTEVLGMRLVKKTINQDDTSVYHLFYADEIGRPGTDLTFFEIPTATNKTHGTSSISGISLRVPSDAALLYWLERFTEFNVEHDGIAEQATRKVIHFRDPEGQCLTLVSDETNIGIDGGRPWQQSNVPVKHGITGIGPCTITVGNVASTITVLTRLLTFQQVGSYPSSIDNQDDVIVLSLNNGGTGAEIHLESRTDLPQETSGSGGVHHIALRVKDEDSLRKWKDYLDNARMPNSGLVDRFYFKSVYFREPNGILIELATDGPGFTIDEDVNHLGEALSLPPNFESKRKRIEAKLTPLHTERPQD
ncbi:MAG TPA: ring-cleaving dioxygenase [Virgibacillus sp.]|nr:ring-cleaving dioxygenase [Virgibacillus sp.]